MKPIKTLWTIVLYCIAISILSYIFSPLLLLALFLIAIYKR